MPIASQLKGIPAKFVKENLNVFPAALVKDINTCIKKWPFPDKRKTADITPTFKKSDNKSNYPPVSVLTILQTFYENVFINK